MNEMFAPLTADELDKAPKPKKQTGTITPIIPVPDDAPAMDYRHVKYGKPQTLWPYYDADGALWGYMARWDFIENGNPEKLLLPLTYCNLGKGAKGWRAKGLPHPRPLYGLPAIFGNPDRPVIITEGEKARDAARDLFPEMVATTPMHGAKSPHLTDFSPLAGRVVIIATDHDDAGQQFGDQLYELLHAAGALQVLHLDPQKLGAWIWNQGEKKPRDSDLPKGWDLADALSEGWTSEHVKAIQADPAFFSVYRTQQEQDSEKIITVDKKPERAKWPFRLTENGVEKRIERTDKDTGTITIEWKWFCSPLAVLASTRSADNDDWGRLLRVTDADQHKKDWAMPMALLAGDGNVYRERLLSMGLILAPGTFARNALHEYISTAKPQQKARCVNRIGWSARSFILPRLTFGENAKETILFQSDGFADDPYRLCGDLESWQNNLARYASGNSRLLFAISAAFAAPLIYPMEAESGGFHFRGGSSIGKTTALTVAGSVWGGRDYIRTWRATSNGLEGVALMHCDTPLLLDEMGQSAAHEIGQVAYMLANGQGKSRARRDGAARRPARWRSLFLSTGELALADKIAEDGKGRKTAAGQEVRIVDIPADAGAGLGLFETLHGFDSADQFARHLKAVAAEHYGHGSHRFLEFLTRDYDAIAPMVSKFQNDFMATHCPANADGQVCRVVARFALVAAGGEIAAACGVVPWQAGEATEAAARCFTDWLNQRGGIEPAEERAALSAVRRFIELHGNARFEPMGSLAPTNGFGERADIRIANRAGFRRPDGSDGLEFIILPEVWRSEVCAGLDAGLVARTLAKHGLIKTASGGKLQSLQRLPGFSNPVRCYVIASAILGEANGQGDD